MVAGAVTTTMAGGRGRPRWSNVPIPEPHVAGLFVGLGLEALAPRRAVADWRLARAAGWGLVGAGLAVIGWAVRTVGARDVAAPSSLVTDGPYAFSRNPMYVGWTALYAGLALLRGSAWLLLALPVVLAGTHLDVRREERTLERRFGAAYRAYRREVRRYL